MIFRIEAKVMAEFNCRLSPARLFLVLILLSCIIRNNPRSDYHCRDHQLAHPSLGDIIRWCHSQQTDQNNEIKCPVHTRSEKTGNYSLTGVGRGDDTEEPDHENRSGDGCDKDHDRFEKHEVNQQSSVITVKRDCNKEWHKLGEQTGNEAAAPDGIEKCVHGISPLLDRNFFPVNTIEMIGPFLKQDLGGITCLPVQGQAIRISL